MKTLGTFKIETSLQLRFLFVLCYGYFDFGTPINFSNISLFNFLHSFSYLLSLLISTYFLFRKPIQPSNPLTVHLRTFCLWIAITMTFLIINWYNFNTYLTGDELAYTGNSWNHIFAVADRMYDYGFFVDELTIEAQSLVRTSNIVILLALVFSFKRLQRLVQRGKWVLALGVIVLLKLMNHHIFHFSFQYLGGYTIPVNLASVVSPTDLMIRVANFSFFLLIILIGTYKEDKKNQALIASVILFLCTATLGNSLHAIDTTIFYIAFGTVVLFRLMRHHDYALEHTIQIAAIGVFFRPANLIWVILCFVVQVRINKVGLLSKNNTVSIMAVVPFLVEISFRVIKNFRSSDGVSEVSSIYFPEAGRALAFLFSINGATDTVFLLAVLVSMLALALSRTALLLFCAYLALVFTLYIHMIPNGIVGQNKYPIEVLTPLAIVFLSVPFQRLLERLDGHQFWFFSAIFATSLIFLLLNKNSKAENFSTYDSKYSQRETFISYPLEVRMELDVIERLSNQKNCVNPGVIYGKPYYVLRGESYRNLSEFSELRERVSVPEEFQRLIGTKDLGCVMIDLISDRDKVEQELLDSGYKLETSLRGEKFKTRFDLYLLEASYRNQID